jgi:hypothetical protein
MSWEGGIQLKHKTMCEYFGHDVSDEEIDRFCQQWNYAHWWWLQQ